MTDHNHYGFIDDELVLPEAGTVLESELEIHLRVTLHLLGVDEDDDLTGRGVIDAAAVRRYAGSVAGHLEAVATAVEALGGRGWETKAPIGDADEMAVAVVAERKAGVGTLVADLGSLTGDAADLATDDMLVVFRDDLAEEDDEEDAEAVVPVRLEAGSLIVDEHEDEEGGWDLSDDDEEWDADDTKPE